MLSWQLGIKIGKRVHVWDNKSSEMSSCGRKPNWWVKLDFLKFRECDGLYMLGPGSGTIRRCGPVRVGVALLE